MRNKVFHIPISTFFCTVFLFIKIISIEVFAENKCNKYPPIYAVIRSHEMAYLDDLKNIECIHGLTIYYSWRELERIEGKYEMEKIENDLKTIKYIGYKVNIGILPGRWSPEWTYSKYKKTFIWNHKDSNVENGIIETSRSPIPWSIEYLNDFLKVQKKLYEILNNHENINSVSLTGPSNSNGLEVAIIGSNAELNSAEYSDAEMISAWKYIIDKNFEYDKKNKKTIALHIQYGENKTNKISKTIDDYAKKINKSDYIPMLLGYNGESWFNKNNLYAGLLFNDDIVDGALQAEKIFSKFSDYKSFEKMYFHSKKIKPKWLEVWAKDIILGYHMKALDK